MTVQALALLLAALVETKPVTTEIDRSSLPAKAETALAAWIVDKNIPADDGDTHGEFYLIRVSGDSPDTFLVDYSGDNPDFFRAIVIIRNGTVIGESIDVGS